MVIGISPAFSEYEHVNEYLSPHHHDILIFTGLGFMDADPALQGGVTAMVTRHDSWSASNNTGNLKAGAVFKKGEEVYWYCTNCGHIEKGLEAPKACPVCAHPQSVFRAMPEGEI